jgi:nicotinamidase-related amidase
VIFVECQNGLLGEASAMRSIAEATAPAIPAMGRLARGARAAGATVVHLTFVPMAKTRSANRRSPLFARLVDHLAHWTPGSWETQPIDEIGVGADDLVLPRSTGFSPTHGTETFRLLRNIGMETLVFAGISANIAIPVSATEATDEDFDVVIASDAIGGSPPEHVQSMLLHTLPFIGTLRTVDELLADWGVKG